MLNRYLEIAFKLIMTLGRGSKKDHRLSIYLRPLDGKNQRLNKAQCDKSSLFPGTCKSHRQKAIRFFGYPTTVEKLFIKKPDTM